ncbi:MAG: oxaloacetate decarboxylase, partial [Acidaminococcaceae bacterium]|nr:oxaloacetate decarboxylase [Acidaminococcaceae bacterium]
DATDIPVIADGDNGYGNALNVIRTEYEFEKAGAACIFFEDQVWPKRCGHMDGKQVITADEHVQKIRAAVEGRVDKETMIMARTDSRAVYGIEDAIERCKRYADAGAEMLFADGLCTREEIERFAKELRGSGAFLDANMIEGGKTPIIPAKELEQMGYSVVFWACSAVYTVTKALYDLFSGLKENGNTDATAAGMMEFGKFNQFIGLDHYKELERKYKVDRDD